MGLFLPLRQPVLLVGPRSPVQLPTCGQARCAPSARRVPRAARSLRPWLRDTSHVVPLLSSWGCPAPSSKPWLGGLAPCSLLLLELRPPGLCRPPGSLESSRGSPRHPHGQVPGPSPPAHAGRVPGARRVHGCPPGPHLPRVSWPRRTMLGAPWVLSAQGRHPCSCVSKPSLLEEDCTGILQIKL